MVAAFFLIALGVTAFFVRGFTRSWRLTLLPLATSLLAVVWTALGQCVCEVRLRGDGRTKALLHADARRVHLGGANGTHKGASLRDGQSKDQKKLHRLWCTRTCVAERQGGPL